MALFFQQGQNPIANMLGDNQGQGPYTNSSSLLSLGLGLLSGKNPQEQAGNAAANFANDRQSGRMTNQTVKFLQTANPELAQAVQSGAISAADAYKLHFQQQEKNKLIAAGGSLYDPGSKQWITPPANPNSTENQESYFGNPIAIETPDHQIRYGQIGNRGSFKPIQIGDGNSFAPPTKVFDTGTAGVMYGPGGVQSGTIQKDVAGESNQKALGAGQGAAALQILPATQIASQIDSQVKALKSDPYLSSMLGPVNSRLPNMTSDAARVQSKIDQLKGASFLAARQMLKGGGQITDYEGSRADAAMARMQAAQTEEDFDAALDDFNGAVQSGVQKLQMQAQGNMGVQPQPGTAQPAPASGAPVMRKFNPVTGKIE